MAPCKFEIDFPYDLKTRRYIVYKCPEPEENIQGNGLCIFHDKTYLRDPEDRKNAKVKFTEKIDKSISNKEPLICIGYNLPAFSLKKKHIDQSIDFRFAIFTNKVDFEGAQLDRKADFQGAHFVKGADFSDFRFPKEVSFLNAQFFGLANFERAQFTGEAEFFNVKFREGANFERAQFTGEAEFFRVEFKGANFKRAQFTGEASFSFAEFTDKANFSHVQFAKEANFRGAQFTQNADFSDVRFAMETDFWTAQFTDRADFKRALFAKRADFSGVQFFGLAHFNDVLFDDQEHIIFRTIDLSRVSFLNTDITRVRFGENVIWGLSDQPTHYLKKRWMYVDKNNFKILEEREIEQILGKHRKERKAAEWRRIETLLTQDELEGLRNIHLGSVLAVYRNLRENYEYRLRYDEAGEFFIREMEMKRNYRMVTKDRRRRSLMMRDWINRNNSLIGLYYRLPKYGQSILIPLFFKMVTVDSQSQIRRNDWVLRNISLIGLYYHLSRYGQSILRPFVFGLGMVILSTLLWSMQPNAAGDFLVNNISPSQIANSSNLETAIERGILNFIPLLPTGVEIHLGFVDYAFKIIGGVVTFGLIVIALRRKFERKFRH